MLFPTDSKDNHRYFLHIPLLPSVEEYPCHLCNLWEIFLLERSSEQWQEEHGGTESCEA